MISIFFLFDSFIIYKSTTVVYVKVQLKIGVCLVVLLFMRCCIYSPVISEAGGFVRKVAAEITVWVPAIYVRSIQ